MASLIIDSISLLARQVRLTGLYLLARAREPFLWIGDMFANFQSVGTTPFSSDFVDI